MVVDNYEEMGCTLDSLNGTPFRDALSAKLVNPMGWTQSAPFPKDNDACTSAMIDVAGSNLPDTVDLSLWIGQSWWFGPPTGAVLHMSSAHEQGCSFTRDTGSNDHDEVRMGDSDNEVAVWMTCNCLRNQNNEELMHAVMRMNHHSHLNLSYATMCYEVGHHNAAWGGADWVRCSTDGCSTATLAAPVPSRRPGAT